MSSTTSSSSDSDWTNETLAVRLRYDSRDTIPDTRTRRHRQSKKHKSAKRKKYSFQAESDHLADCRFIVGRMSHQQIIKGHKMVLALSSPVFEAMFYGDLAETNDPIPIKDVEPDAFKAMLKYIYTGIVNPESSKLAYGLCYCANKYMLTFLVDECIEYIKSDLSATNVCHGYEFAKLIDNTLLMNNCKEIIRTKTSIVLSDPSFKEIQLEILLEIFDDDELRIDSEIELFTAVELWAKSECIRKKLDPNNRESLRSVIGNALEKIRFLTLTPEEFAHGIANSLLLDENEGFVIFFNIATNENKKPMPKGFSINQQHRTDSKERASGTTSKSLSNRGQQTPHRKIMVSLNSGSQCQNCSYGRYSEAYTYDKRAYINDSHAKNDFVNFSVNKNIVVHGVEISSRMKHAKRFGTRVQSNSYTYNEMLTITLYNPNETILTSVDYTDNVGNDHANVVEVMFNRSVNIEKDKIYTIDVTFKENVNYPTISGDNQKAFSNSVSFSFKVGNNTGIIKSIIFSNT